MACDACTQLGDPGVSAFVVVLSDWARDGRRTVSLSVNGERFHLENFFDFFFVCRCFLCFQADGRGEEYAGVSGIVASWPVPADAVLVMYLCA